MFSANSYVPGKMTSPVMVSVRRFWCSACVGMKSTSSFSNGTSAEVPSIMPFRSMEITSWVRLGFIRRNTARETMASSVRPSALSMRLLTLLTFSPRRYIPPRKTAPLISTMFSYRLIIVSTDTSSPSSILNPGRSNSSTLNTDFIRPLLRFTRRDFL